MAFDSRKSKHKQPTKKPLTSNKKVTRLPVTRQKPAAKKTTAPQPAAAKKQVAPALAAQPPKTTTTATGSLTVPQVAPEVLKYISTDPTYMQALANIGQVWTDYQAKHTRDVGTINAGYARQKNATDLARKEGLNQNATSFAGRGLLSSSPYADTMGKLSTAYNSRADEEAAGYTNQLNAQSDEELNQRRQNEAAIRLQQTAAVQRRSNKLSGLGT